MSELAPYYQEIYSKKIKSTVLRWGRPQTLPAIHSKTWFTYTRGSHVRACP